MVIKMFEAKFIALVNKSSVSDLKFYGRRFGFNTIRLGEKHFVLGSDLRLIVAKSFS